MAISEPDVEDVLGDYRIEEKVALTKGRLQGIAIGLIVGLLVVVLLPLSN